MSDRTPPSPPPPEPSLPHGSTQSFPTYTPHPDDYPTPKKRRKRGTGLTLSLVGAGAILILLLVVVAGVVLSPDAPPGHDVGTPDRAGGLQRDPDAEKEMAGQLTSIRSQFRSAATSDFRQFVTAVYTKPATDDAGPAGPIVLIAASFPKSGNPEDFVSDFRQSVAKRAGFKAIEVDAGPDARGVCAASTTSLKLAQCAWSTHDSFGELLPAGTGWDAEQLAALMRQVRPDVETTRG